MSKLFPKIRCSIVTVTTVKGDESYIVPSENAAEAVAQFNRPDALVKASGNHWAQVSETDGDSFQLEMKDQQFTLELGDPGYNRVRSAHSKLIAKIEQEKWDQYNDQH